MSLRVRGLVCLPGGLTAWREGGSVVTLGHKCGFGPVVLSVVCLPSWPVRESQNLSRFWVVGVGRGRPQGCGVPGRGCPLGLWGSLACGGPLGYGGPLGLWGSPGPVGIRACGGPQGCGGPLGLCGSPGPWGSSGPVGVLWACGYPLGLWGSPGAMGFPVL